MEQTSLALSFPDPQSAMALVGKGEENLKTLSQQTGAKLVQRGQELLLSGTPTQVDRTRDLIKLLEPLWKAGKTVAPVDISTAVQALNTNRQDELEDLRDDIVVQTRKGEPIRAKTFRQRQYIKTVRRYDLTFCTGPAGTGKTYLATMLAVKALTNKEYDRLILTRPAVEAGEKLGFLPGDLQQKVNPFLRPLYDALYELIDPIKIPDLMERGIVEVAPLAYMRGRTLSNAFVILDEAQNTTPAQMKMVLTRLGFNAKMVVTGDLTQTDLPGNSPSGLDVAIKILRNVDGIGFCQMTAADVVRHALVQRIVGAYEQYEKRS